MTGGGGERLRAALRLIEAYRERSARGHAALRRHAGSLAGQVVFCLGAGPSLRDEDPSRLEGCHVICTNHAHRFLTGTRVASRWQIVTDNARAEELLGELSAGRGPIVVAPNRLTTDWLALVDRHPGACVLWSKPWLSPRQDGGWDVEPHVGFTSGLDLGQAIEHAGHSVIFAAIQLAVFLGADTIVLLGVDMDYTGPLTHFAGNVTHTNPGFDYETHARPAFVWFGRELARRGVALLNATRGGRVEALERVTLDEAVTLARPGADWPGGARATARQRAARHLALRLRIATRATGGPGGTRRRLALWGAGSGGRGVAALLDGLGPRIDLVVDADPEKAGGRLHGVMVAPPAQLDEDRWREAVVLVASVHHAEIVTWLTGRGRAADSIVVADLDGLCGP